MTVSHVATVSTVRNEVAEAEGQVTSLKEQLREAEVESQTIHRAGQAVLNALKASMAPLMADLAIERKDLGDHIEHVDQPYDHDCPFHETIADMEKEIAKLHNNIKHYQETSDRLQAGERQRSHEIRRLKIDVSEAAESLSYEKQRVRHHEDCKQYAFDACVDSWAGLGPSGIGRRTMEVRAEKKLRESAEQRQGRLKRDVQKLDGDKTCQQTQIQQLWARIGQLRAQNEERDKQLSHHQHQNTILQSRLNAATKGVAHALGTTQGSSKLAGTGQEDDLDDEQCKDTVQADEIMGPPKSTSLNRKPKPRPKKKSKVPQLSF